MAAGRMIAADVEAGIATFTYNADGQRSAKQGTDASVIGYLYDYKRLLHETDTVGGVVTKTYASGATDEFGDLIGEEGEFSHQYDAMANTEALLDDSGVERNVLAPAFVEGEGIESAAMSAAIPG